MAIERLSQASILTLNKYSSMMAGSAAGDYELISTVTVSGSSTSAVTFDVSAFTSSYKHLQARIMFRSGINVNGDDHQLRFNGDSTYSNYRSHYLYGNGSASPSSATLQSTQFPGINLSVNTADSSHTAGVYGVAIVDIPEAFSTSKNKVVKSFSGMPQAGTANYGITMASGIWISTAAITSITFYPYPGTSPYIAAGSKYSLYGIRG